MDRGQDVDDGEGDLREEKGIGRGRDPRKALTWVEISSLLGSR